MSKFVTDLILYYACALSAEAGALPSGEAMRCSLAYERAKVHFYAAPAAPVGTRARAGQSRDAFLAFREWEDANPDDVDALKDMARQMIGGGQAT